MVLEELVSRSFILESLCSLLGDEFDPKVFAADTIHHQMVGEMLQKLTSGIAELDKEIYSQVNEPAYDHS